MANMDIPTLCNNIDRLEAQLAEMQKQRDALADALWCAEDQWGDDYLWKKWNLSEHLTEELKNHLKEKAVERCLADQSPIETKPAYIEWPVVLKIHGYDEEELKRIFSDRSSREALKKTHDILDKAVRDAIPAKYYVNVSHKYTGEICIDLIPIKNAGGGNGKC